jgi:hypothetical protein
VIVRRSELRSDVIAGGNGIKFSGWWYSIVMAPEFRTRKSLDDLDGILESTDDGPCCLAFSGSVRNDVAQAS